MFYDQQPYSVRCEWGEQGLRHLAPYADAVVIVDVLSFTTCVDVALSRGAEVLPYRWRDESAAAFAEAHGALLASHERRFTGGFSLSPTSLLGLPAGVKLVLPSPNGATLCAVAEELLPERVFAAGLRNAKAVGKHLKHHFERVLVIPAGERWQDDSLRPALEDWLGAGAVIEALGMTNSPEAQAAAHAFLDSKNDLLGVLKACSSGRELTQRGFEKDVELAAHPNESDVVPRLQQGTFRALASGA